MAVFWREQSYCFVHCVVNASVGFRNPPINLTTCTYKGFLGPIIGVSVNYQIVNIIASESIYRFNGGGKRHLGITAYCNYEYLHCNAFFQLKVCPLVIINRCEHATRTKIWSMW